MDKTERIIDLVEHPDRYTEDDIEQLLNDEDSRRLYQTVMETREAFILENALSPNTHHLSPLRQIAAVFIGLLLVSGIALAAVNIVRSNKLAAPKPQTEQVAEQQRGSAPKDTATEKSAAKPRIHKTFENVTLETMLSEMADYYGLSVSYADTGAKVLRLYYEWDSQKPVEQVVKDLNQFENVNLTLRDKTITVE